MENAKPENLLYKSAAALLLLTAAAKLFGAFGNAKILHVQDQLLHLGYRPVMLLAALVEIVVAFFLLKSRGNLQRSLALLWLSANFLAYHLGNYLLGIHYCPCLGSLADRLPLPRGLPNVFLLVITGYWFVASLDSLWRLWGAEQWARLVRRPRFSVFRKPPSSAQPL